jgi:glycosyltransferase involved in cell wall biosynthesis
MAKLLNKVISKTEKRNMHRLIQKKYNWNRVAEQTIEVYEKLMEVKN